MYRSAVAKWLHYEPELQPLVRALGGTVQAYESALKLALAAREAQAAKQQLQAEDDAEAVNAGSKEEL